MDKSFRDYITLIYQIGGFSLPPDHYSETDPFIDLMKKTHDMGQTNYLMIPSKHTKVITPFVLFDDPQWKLYFDMTSTITSYSLMGWLQPNEILDNVFDTQLISTIEFQIIEKYSTFFGCIEQKLNSLPEPNPTLISTYTLFSKRYVDLVMKMTQQFTQTNKCLNLDIIDINMLCDWMMILYSTYNVQLFELLLKETELLNAPICDAVFMHRTIPVQTSIMTLCCKSSLLLPKFIEIIGITRFVQLLTLYPEEDNLCLNFLVKTKNIRLVLDMCLPHEHLISMLATYRDNTGKNIMHYAYMNYIMEWNPLITDSIFILLKPFYHLQTISDNTKICPIHYLKTYPNLVNHFVDNNIITVANLFTSYENTIPLSYLPAIFKYYCNSDKKGNFSDDITSGNVISYNDIMSSLMYNYGLIPDKQILKLFDCIIMSIITKHKVTADSDTWTDVLSEENRIIKSLETGVKLYGYDTVFPLIYYIGLYDKFVMLIDSLIEKKYDSIVTTLIKKYPFLFPFRPLNLYMDNYLGMSPSLFDALLNNKNVTYVFDYIANIMLNKNTLNVVENPLDFQQIIAHNIIPDNHHCRMLLCTLGCIYFAEPDLRDYVLSFVPDQQFISELICIMYDKWYITKNKYPSDWLKTLVTTCPYSIIDILNKRNKWPVIISRFYSSTVLTILESDDQTAITSSASVGTTLDNICDSFAYYSENPKIFYALLDRGAFDNFLDELGETIDEILKRCMYNICVIAQLPHFYEKKIHEKNDILSLAIEVKNTEYFVWTVNNLHFSHEYKSAFFDQHSDILQLESTIIRALLHNNFITSDVCTYDRYVNTIIDIIQSKQHINAFEEYFLSKSMDFSNDHNYEHIKQILLDPAIIIVFMINCSPLCYTYKNLIKNDQFRDSIESQISYFILTSWMLPMNETILLLIDEKIITLDHLNMLINGVSYATRLINYDTRVLSVMVKHYGLIELVSKTECVLSDIVNPTDIFDTSDACFILMNEFVKMSQSEIDGINIQYPGYVTKLLRQCITNGPEMDSVKKMFEKLIDMDRLDSSMVHELYQLSIAHYDIDLMIKFINHAQTHGQWNEQISLLELQYPELSLFGPSEPDIRISSDLIEYVINSKYYTPQIQDKIFLHYNASIKNNIVIELLKLTKFSSPSLNPDTIQKLMRQYIDIFINFLRNDIDTDKYICITDNDHNYLITQIPITYVTPTLKDLFVSHMTPESLLALNKRRQPILSTLYHFKNELMKQTFFVDLFSRQYSTSLTISIQKVFMNYVETIGKTCTKLSEILSELPKNMHMIKGPQLKNIVMISLEYTKIDELDFDIIDPNLTKYYLTDTDQENHSVMHYIIRFRPSLLTKIMKFYKLYDPEWSGSVTENGSTFLMYALEHNPQTINLLMMCTGNEQNYSLLTTGSIVSHTILYADSYLEKVLQWKHFISKSFETYIPIPVYDYFSDDASTKTIECMSLLAMTCISNPKMLKTLLDTNYDFTDQINGQTIIGDKQYSLIELAMIYEPSAFQLLLGSKYYNIKMFDDLEPKKMCKCASIQPASWYLFANSSHLKLYMTHHKIVKTSDFVTFGLEKSLWISSLPSKPYMQSKQEYTNVLAERCEICLTNKKKILFGCMSHTTCAGCAARSNVCPFCRSDEHTRVRLCD